MLSLAKSTNFDMTLMFAEDGDHKQISDIVSKLGTYDPKLAADIKAKFNNE